VLDALENGDDIYKLTAASVFGIPVETVSDAIRQMGKVMTLALGYGGGRSSLIECGYPETRGLKDVVNSWREVRHKTASTWKLLHKTANTALIEGSSSVEFEDGRKYTFSAEAKESRAGKLLCAHFECGGISVDLVWPNASSLGEDSGSKRSIRYHSGGVVAYAWNGVVFQNCIQALAARCLQQALLNCDAAGLDIVGHVHDEIIVECDEEDTPRVEAKLVECMQLRNFGNLLKAEVWSGERYGKN
jgi:DNA polymerase